MTSELPEILDCGDICCRSGWRRQAASWLAHSASPVIHRCHLGSKIAVYHRDRQKMANLGQPMMIRSSFPAGSLLADLLPCRAGENSCCAASTTHPQAVEMPGNIAKNPVDFAPGFGIFSRIFPGGRENRHRARRRWPRLTAMGAYFSSHTGDTPPRLTSRPITSMREEV
jgi:hypothetical protein